MSVVLFDYVAYTLNMWMHNVIKEQPLPTLETSQKICKVFISFFDRIRCACGEHGRQLADLHWDNIGVTSHEVSGAIDRSTCTQRSHRMCIHVCTCIGRAFLYMPVCMYTYRYMNVYGKREDGLF